MLLYSITQTRQTTMKITVELDTTVPAHAAFLASVIEAEIASPEPRKVSPSASEPDPGTDSPEGVSEALLEQAIEKARDLLENKQTAKVKKALTKAGVERVSHLSTNDQVNAFLEALS